MEERGVRVQVPAHDVGARAAPSVSEQRHHFPREWIEKSEYRHRFSIRLAAHRVVIAIGQHDHVSAVSPMTLTIVDGYPARAVGHDVEQDEALRPRMKSVG